MKIENVLYNDEAISKLKYLAEDIKTCMFCSNLQTFPMTSIPMTINQVDFEGNIWFISSISNNKNFQKINSNEVQLFFSDMSDSNFLSVFGLVSVYHDINYVENIWSTIGKAWFEESISDNDVKVIKVTPTSCYYWDANENKISLTINENIKFEKSLSVDNKVYVTV